MTRSIVNVTSRVSPGNKFNSLGALDISTRDEPSARATTVALKLSLATSWKGVKFGLRACTYKSRKRLTKDMLDLKVTRAFIAITPLLASCASSGLYYMSDDWCERHLAASAARCPENQAENQELAQLRTDAPSTDPAARDP